MKNHVKERNAHTIERNIVYAEYANGIPKEAGL